MDRYFLVRVSLARVTTDRAQLSEFEPVEGKKGPRAQAVRIVTKPLATRINTHTFRHQRNEMIVPFVEAAGRKWSRV